MKLDAGRVWTDAMNLLAGQREILLTITAFFIMLPSLLLNTLRPFIATGSRDTLLRELMNWTEANFMWIVLAAMLAALGRLAILILLLGPGRPTVGEALSAGGRLLILFVFMDVLIGFIWLGGFLLFVIPGLYLVGRTFLAEPAFVAGQMRNPMAAIAHGFEMSRGNGWRLVVMIAVIYLAGTILTAAVGSVAGVIGALVGAAGLDRFLNAGVEALFGAAMSLILALVGVAAWRQLSQDRNLRSNVAG